METRVVFRVFRDGEVIALFPDIPADYNGFTVTSYVHIGQHGAADYRTAIAGTRPATPEQYADLLAELVRIGYGDLRIVKRARPRAYEVAREQYA